MVGGEVGSDVDEGISVEGGNAVVYISRTGQLLGSGVVIRGASSISSTPTMKPVAMKRASNINYNRMGKVCEKYCSPSGTHYFIPCELVPSKLPLRHVSSHGGRCALTTVDNGYCQLRGED